MFRVTLRFSILILLFFVTMIVLMLQIGTRRSSSLMLYNQTQYSGFRLWDIRTQRSYEILSIDDIGTGPILIPSWSPDGSEFAFILREDVSGNGVLALADNLYRADAFGRDFQLVLDNHDTPPLSYSIANPSMLWSPNSEMIALYLDVFAAPQLWILSKDGTIITETASQFPADDSLDGLPTSGSLIWSADSQTLYVVSRYNGLRYQTLPVEVNAELSASQMIDLPESIVSIDAFIPSPIAAEFLIYDDESDKLWRVDIANELIYPIEAMTDTNLTALAWSNDGSRIGWVQRDLHDSRIYTLSLDDNRLRQYHLPPEVATDLSFNMWLPENPPQVIVRMQRGSFCRNRGTNMTCADPNFYAASWFGIRP